MDADPLQPARYQAEIQALIATVEACLGDVGEDRESRLQRAAFGERCERARDITGRLLSAGESELAMLTGDALRCLDALRLSQAFFRERALEPA